MGHSNALQQDRRGATVPGCTVGGCANAGFHDGKRVVSGVACLCQLKLYQPFVILQKSSTPLILPAL